MLNYENAYEKLIILHNDLPKKYNKLYLALLEILNQDDMLSHIRIRHNKFIFQQDFLIAISKNPIFTKINVNSNKIYDFFEYLKSNNFISEESDFYPIRKPLAQMNKYHSFLSNKNFYLVDMIDDFIDYVHLKLSQSNLKLAVFISLVYFEENNWNEEAIDNAYFENFFICNAMGYQSILGEELEDGFRTIKTYKLKLTSLLMKRLKDTNLDKEFTSYKEMQILAKDIIKNYFSISVSITSIRKAIIFNKIMEMPPAIVACMYKTNATVPLSLSELNYLYPDIPSHLMKIESNNLNLIDKSNKLITEYDDYADEMYIETEFDYDFKISNLLYYKENQKRINILRSTPKDIKIENIKYIQEQMLLALKFEKDTSTRMVIEYIYYLLDKVYVGQKKSNEINITTFINYIGILKNHFFSEFSDYENIDESKLFFILDTSKHKGAALNSIKKLNYLVRDFFNFNNKRFTKYKINAKQVMKSIIFKDEIDVILQNIEIYIREVALNNNTKYSKFYKYIVLQYQAFIILSFYTGMRLNETRTRMHSDIVKELFYIYDKTIQDNVYSIDINVKGLKKDKNIKKLDSFKSSNASRRVNFRIIEDNHAKIFNDFLQISKGTYLFTDFDIVNRKPFSAVMKLSRLDLLNKIIRKVTSRYATIHSLRHSYATYWLLDRIVKKENFNEILLNFSIEIGHVTPEITMQSYMHYELIEELLQNAKY